MAIGIIYGSNGGATESVAEMIHEKLGLEASLVDVGEIEAEAFGEYSHLIIGTSTWGEGDLQDDWDDIFDDYSSLEFGGKTVAFFGVGDQEGYADNFLDAMGTLHEVVVKNGGTVVGDGWSTDGYNHDESTAVNDNGFIGLVIDDDNQDGMTEERIEKWVEIIKPFFK
ncbi:MAG: flavodoxin [Campylobacterota bacterium]|nr:flavodoxin [Campylobacterota bacterium]